MPVKNALLFLLAFVPLLMLTGCRNTANAPSTDGMYQEGPDTYHDEVGHFRFRLGASWRKMSAEELGFFNAYPDIRFDAGFKKVGSEPYFLVQIRRVGKERKERVNAYIGHARHTDSILDLALNVHQEPFTLKDVFYESKQFFMWALQYQQDDPAFSVMAKVFSSYGYVNFHFYFNSPKSLVDLTKDLKDVRDVIDTFEFDEGCAFDLGE